MARFDSGHHFYQLQQALPILPHQGAIFWSCSLFFNRPFFRLLILPLLGGISYMFSRSGIRTRQGIALIFPVCRKKKVLLVVIKSLPTHSH